MKNPVVITLHLTDHLDKAFKVLPSNALIHKGRCGIGGTTLEIYARRCSIIIVPTKGTIINKISSHPEIFGVHCDVTNAEIANYLKSKTKYKKIMTTPDSFGRIIDAAATPQERVKLFKEFFLLFDECHTAITEAFRGKILLPYKYMDDFKNKTLISATPGEFSDERILKLTPYFIKFHERYLGEIRLRQTANVEACVDWYIANRDLFPGELFFFYNSVKEMAETIRRNNLTSDIAHIYCADKKENFDKLSEHLLAFQQDPITGQYAKINFFTTKYFEGFDLYADNATIILVTDVHKAHTKVGITNKGVQAIGRLRVPPNQFIHITNNRNKEGMKTRSQFKKEYEIHTRKLIAGYNSYITECRNEGIDPIEDTEKPIIRFVDIDEETKLATLVENKFEQVINELVSNEQFNNSSTTIEAWEQSLYKVNERPFKSKSPVKKYRSKADKFREFVELIEELENNKDGYIMGYASRELAKQQQVNPFAFEAYFLLGKTVLEELKYNDGKVKERVIDQHNKNVEPQLLAYLDKNIVVGERYLIAVMTRILQYGYKLFQIRNPKTGKVKTADAEAYQQSSWYKLRECKIKINGKDCKGFIIEQKFFSIQNAA